MKKKLAIIGAGLSGLASAYFLYKDFDITIFEKNDFVGGMGGCFKLDKWDWPIEKHYHHVFASDKFFKNLAKDLHIDDHILEKKPKTSIYIDKKIYSFSGAKDLLSFSKLSLADRLKLGSLLVFFKLLPDGRILDKYTAFDILKKNSKKAFLYIWEPLFYGKFKDHASVISASWIWARIHTRTSKLVYFKKSFCYFFDVLYEFLRQKGVSFKLSTPVLEVKKDQNFCIKTQSGPIRGFDLVINTTVFPVFKSLFTTNIDIFPKFDYLHANTLVLILKNKFLKSTYWLNINEKDFPFVGLIEHTNFISKKYFNNDHILYISNYSAFVYKKQDLLKKYLPYLKKINKNIDIKQSFLFTQKYAQPIITVNTADNISMTTPIDGLFMANIENTYPYDRGLNFAIKKAHELAYLIKNKYL